MERRWHHRTEIDIPATLAVNGKHLPAPCRIRNFSAGGLFLETAQTTQTLARHQFVQVHIHPHGVSPRIIEGMIIRVDDAGVGIEADTRFWSQALNWG
ncbi:PilZ domain-containing protein [Thiocapsa rosea]|uniref:PilZ domain-containing protein n=1 Tax=Thiocapsa rosea TaxID=69360 RepID=A0A495V9J7_9GAMM|nr:PilZ domain-containing protein [Thiocapsa rosea]RKT45410.1 PilZ domain-containing protein [Thiocapsa rosea]